ncbi:MAG: glycoside hydrolase family 11 protein [Oscillospiraceae bacterium]|jgi:endo-1,4-beta-xylanase|nr:glycoside hydrolase family 11 protein [Oscillospiraceae bacterium]
MNRKIVLILAVLFAFLPLVSAASDPITMTQNKRGSRDGFDYEFWTQRSTDESSMTLTGGGTFTCEWSGFNNLLRIGKKLGSTKTYEDYGDIFLEYGAIYNITRGDVSYLCVYGWTENPLIEFYVVENYGNYIPTGGQGYRGRFEADGSMYDIYVGLRVDQPSIHGDKTTFEQYYSVRVDKRNEGTISITEHFKAWEEIGLDMSGTLYEVSLCVEGFQSRGNANVYSHVLTIGDTVYGEPGEYVEPVEPDEPDEIEVEAEPSATEPEAEPTPSPSPDAPAAPSPIEPDAPSPAAPVTPAGSTEEPSKPVPVWFIVTIVVIIAVAATFITIAVRKGKRGSDEAS